MSEKLKIEQIVTAVIEYMPATLGTSIGNRIAESVLAVIATGIAREGDEMPTLREIGDSALVGVNSIQSGYVLCENFGYLKKCRGRRSIVSISQKEAKATLIKTITNNDAKKIALKFSILKIGSVEATKIIANHMTKPKASKSKKKNETEKLPS